MNVFYTLPITNTSTGESNMQLIPKPVYDHVLEVHKKLPKTQKLVLTLKQGELIINIKNKHHAKTKK